MLRALCHNLTLNARRAAAVRVPSGCTAYSVRCSEYPHPPRQIDSTSISGPPKRRHPRRIISTFRPDLLSPSDYFDFSDIAYPKIWSGSPLRHAVVYYVPYSSIPFPPNTRGFLYFHSPSPSSTASASLSSIRLRLTPTPNPASFPLGTDLLNKDRTHPWSIPFLNIITRPSCCGLCEILLRDGTIHPEILHELSTFTADPFSRRRYFQNSRVLRTLDEPFALDLGVGTTRVYIMARGETQVRILDSRGRRSRFPYTGIIKVRFEVSTLPGHERNSHLVYRVVEIVKPVQCAIPHYDGYVPMPKVGELLRACGGRRPMVKKVNAALQHLIKTSETSRLKGR